MSLGEVLQDVKINLGYYIECMMNDYLDERGSELSVETDEFINDDVFLKCLGVTTGQTTIKQLKESLNLYEELNGDRSALEIFHYFDWDKYCEYYYTTLIND